MKLRILPWIPYLCLALSARAGTVTLLSGESYDGKLQFANNQIVVNVGNGSPTTVDLSNLLDAFFPSEQRKGKESKAELLPAGVRLVNGTVLAGTPPLVTDTSAKLGEIPITMSSVAWIIYAPISRDDVPQPSPGQTGAILPSGDFFPGIFGGIQDNKIAINSVIFGPQRFVIKGAKSQIAALVLRDIQPNAGRYLVISKDGSTYQTDQIGTDHEGVLIRDTIAGNLKLKTDNLYEIRLNNSQYQNLATVRPLQVTPPKGADPATAFTAKPADGTNPATLQTLVNTAVTFTVPPGFTVFSASVFLPKEAPPAARCTFAVYSDGKFLLSRSSNMSSNDNPQHLRVNIVNAHTITLQMEPASPGFPTVQGKWTQPMMLKP